MAWCVGKGAQEKTQGENMGRLSSAPARRVLLRWGRCSAEGRLCTMVVAATGARRCACTATAGAAAWLFVWLAEKGRKNKTSERGIEKIAYKKSILMIG